MLTFGVASTPGDLMAICQGLMNAQLMRLMSMEGKTCWALRTKDVANKIATLTEEERMVYNQIENTGTTGIWQKNIKQRTNLHQTAITKAMKTLEAKRLVKQIKSVKHPAQKIYMLMHLAPNEDVTGGPWFSEGELDVELIGITANAVVDYIKKKSWIDGYIKTRKRKRVDDIEGPHPKSKRRGIRTQLPYPPAYHGYPTVAELTHFIREAGFIKDVLTESDIQGLLDVLVFDDRIEKINGGYRTVRGVEGPSDAMMGMMHGRGAGEAYDDQEGNGITQAPCGRCPVFALCGDDGPVNAQTCVYWKSWLGKMIDVR
ncbi:34-kDa subunit of RNA polymerase III (C) [Taxawa tesnikishii (nom. ined.)]|nr:34-kDa subunit of RNA polymerase III (C) [Dothideales sp. JES 119]